MRTRQLAFESSAVAALLLILLLGGTASTLDLPPVWTNVQNPSTLITQYDLNALALQYNQTLATLGNQNFGRVAYLLNDTIFLEFPPSLSSPVNDSVFEIGSTNASIPLAISGFNSTRYLIGIGELKNASTTLGLACTQIQNANLSFAKFTETTTRQFSSDGVPVFEYSIGQRSVSTLLNHLLGECTQLQGIIRSLIAGSRTVPTNFTIFSSQKDIVTGGYVKISGNLTVNFTGLGEIPVAFYVNGTRFATSNTSSDGIVIVNAAIPFVYNSTVAIWAVASSTSGFSGAVSNTLYFTILFNETQIVVGDPPPILPTFSFVVQGTLNTTSGDPLPNAPVKITSFGQNYFVSTNSKGVFKTTLTVPANATDGIYYIYAAFAPQGTYGPSVNFTSIEVVHEPLTITLNPIPLAYSGFGGTLSGTARANGSGLSNANITINSDWGSSLVTTDANGNFKASFPVPLYDFGFSSSAIVSASPVEAYIDSGSVVTPYPTFNLLWIILPLVTFAAVTFGAYKTGVLGKLGKSTLFKRGNATRSSLGREQEKAVEETVQKLVSAKSPSSSEIPEMIQIYKNALLLAVKRYSLVLLPSMTIREILALVEKVQGSKNEDFRRISFLFEDYLYSRDYDQKSVSQAVLFLGSLERSWSH